MVRCTFAKDPEPVDFASVDDLNRILEELGHKEKY